MRGIVYLLRNKANEKVYVGQTTKTLVRRWKQHLASANGQSQRVIHRAIRKYRPESFTQEILADGENQQELDVLEAKFIIYFRAQNSKFGYNCAAGGRSPRVGSKHSEKTKAKLKAAWVRRKARGYSNAATFTTTGRQSWNAGLNWTQNQRDRLMATRKAGWTPERRAAQAERCRQQNQLDPERCSRRKKN